MILSSLASMAESRASTLPPPEADVGELGILGTTLIGAGAGAGSGFFQLGGADGAGAGLGAGLGAGAELPAVEPRFAAASRFLRMISLKPPPPPPPA